MDIDINIDYILVDSEFGEYLRKSILNNSDIVIAVGDQKFKGKITSIKFYEEYQRTNFHCNIRGTI